MVTLGINLGSFSLGKPREKLPKSIPLVTIFFLIGSPWQILYIRVSKCHATVLSCIRAVNSSFAIYDADLSDPGPSHNAIYLFVFSKYCITTSCSQLFNFTVSINLAAL